MTRARIGPPCVSCATAGGPNPRAALLVRLLAHAVVASHNFFGCWYWYCMFSGPPSTTHHPTPPHPTCFNDRHIDRRLGWLRCRTQTATVAELLLLLSWRQRRRRLVHRPALRRPTLTLLTHTSTDVIHVDGLVDAVLPGPPMPPSQTVLQGQRAPALRVFPSNAHE